MRWRFLLFLLLLLPEVASTHPFLHNSWWTVAESNRLVLRVTATLREIAVIQKVDPATLIRPDSLHAAASNHAAYVVGQLHIDIDGKPLPIAFLDYQLLLDDSPEPEDSSQYPDLTHVAYDLECALPTRSQALPVRFSHSTLRGHAYAPGIPWETYHILQVTDPSRATLGQAILRIGTPHLVTLPALLNAPPMPAVAAASDTAPPPLQGWTSFNAFLRHGLHHVITGYDHLLFLVALALASVSWRRLLGIIAVFTAAHSITVTLAALGWISLPPSVVEPVIAGSIVFVALENVLAPARSQRSSRLVIAFAFGLIHGLGFAGGLREALPNGSSAQLALPILAFCIGVELGHLAVGAPLYGIFRAAVPRAGSPTTPAPTGSTPALHPVIRWGSVLTACGGAGYLWAALQSA
jgi:hydrogenase/urease accessory protein HupE